MAFPGLERGWRPPVGHLTALSALPAAALQAPWVPAPVAGGRAPTTLWAASRLPDSPPTVEQALGPTTPPTHRPPGRGTAVTAAPRSLWRPVLGTGELVLPQALPGAPPPDRRPVASPPGPDTPAGPFRSLRGPMAALELRSRTVSWASAPGAVQVRRRPARAPAETPSRPPPPPVTAPDLARPVGPVTAAGAQSEAPPPRFQGAPTGPSAAPATASRPTRSGPAAGRPFSSAPRGTPPTGPGLAPSRAASLTEPPGPPLPWSTPLVRDFSAAATLSPPAGPGPGTCPEGASPGSAPLAHRVWQRLQSGPVAARQATGGFSGATAGTTVRRPWSRAHTSRTPARAGTGSARTGSSPQPHRPALARSTPVWPRRLATRPGSLAAPAPPIVAASPFRGAPAAGPGALQRTSSAPVARAVRPRLVAAAAARDRSGLLALLPELPPAPDPHGPPTAAAPRPSRELSAGPARVSSRASTASRATLVAPGRGELAPVAETAAPPDPSTSTAPASTGDTPLSPPGVTRHGSSLPPAEPTPSRPAPSSPGPVPTPLARAALRTTLEGVSTARSVEGLPRWAFRATGGTPVTTTGDLVQALAVARSPLEVLRLSLDSGTSLRRTRSLPAPVAALLRQVRAEAARAGRSVEASARKLANEAGGPTARVLAPARPPPVSTTPLAPRSTPPPGPTTDGASTRRVGRLAQRLLDLIHLVQEEGRLSDARRQVRLAAQGTEPQTAGEATAAPQRTAALDALRKEVVSSVSQALESRRELGGLDDDHGRW